MILAKLWLWLIFGPDVEIAMFQELEAPESVPREEDTSAGSLEEQLQQQKNQKDGLHNILRTPMHTNCRIP